MLEVLRFVKAAVCKNDLQPTLLCFRIKDGFITGFNGQTAIRCPLQVGLDCAPNAMQFVRAIAACGSETVAMHVDGGKLRIHSGKFKTSVDISPDPTRFPDLDPEGETIPIQAPILPILKRMLPFVGTDPARPWQCGVLFCNNSVFATNNVRVVELWQPTQFPVIANMPTEAMRELIRLNVEPVAVQASPNRVVFHLPGNAWISVKLMSYEWPDLSAIWSKVEGVATPPVPAGFFEAIKRVEPFTDELGRVYLYPGYVSTVQQGDPGGTQCDAPESPYTGLHRVSLLLSMQDEVTGVGFHNYPKPIPFVGPNLRGVFMGYSMAEARREPAPPDPAEEARRAAFKAEFDAKYRQWEADFNAGLATKQDEPIPF